MTASCICIVSALYRPSMGGVESYTAHLAHALAAAGHRVIVVTSNTHGLEGRAEEDGIEVVRLPCRGLLGNRYPAPRKNADYRQLWSWLEDQRIDYVVVNTRFYPLSYAGLAFARSKGIAPVLVEHGSAHLTMGHPVIDAGVEAVEHALTRAERSFGAAHYGVSRKASAWLAHFGIEACGQLPNAIDADAYRARASTRDFRRELGIPPETFLVASVGRLVAEKGVVELAQAMEGLPEGADAVALVAGDGPLRATLERFESERFRLVGKLDPSDVAALLVQADALCLPSRSEGFATVLLEAAACETPAITTDVGGVDELIVSEEYGTVIADRSAETLRRALESAVRDRQRVEEQGRAVGERVRAHCSWKRTADLVVEACERAQRAESSS